MRKNTLLFVLSIIIGLLLSLSVRGYDFISPSEIGIIKEFIDKLLDFVSLISIALVPLIMIIAGRLLITAAGNSEKIAQAKKIIIWTLIIFSLILFLRVVVTGPCNPPCTACEECDIETGNCDPQDTDWGKGDAYGCIGPNKRCVAGICETGACTSCAECPSGDYCDSTSRDCFAFPTCTKCGAGGFDFTLQANNEDLQGECGTTACGTGECSGVGQYCGYYTSGQQNCNRCWECDGSGTCIKVSTGWGGGAAYDCVGPNSRCVDGTCETVQCNECSPDCSPGMYCHADTNTCGFLPTCTECNAGYGYNFQESDEDLGGDCDETGCGTGDCSGTSASCGYYTDNERHGCSVCHACDTSGQCTARSTPPGAGDYGCIGANMRCLNGVCQLFAPGPCPLACTKGSNCPSGKYCYQPSFSIPFVCPSCKSLPGGGVCIKRNEDDFGIINTDSGWGDNEYGCNGSDKRCYGGICRTCGGYKYNDGCNGCSAPSGSPSTSACWYSIATGDSCDEGCSTHGGCISGKWTDSNSCSVAEHWTNCSGCFLFICNSCGENNASDSPRYAPGLWNTCQYRTWPSFLTQSCSQTTSSPYKRLCVCNY